MFADAGFSQHALIMGVVIAGTLGLAAALRHLLADAQEQPHPRLDARGMLLFVPLVVLFALDAPLTGIVALLTAIAVYLLTALGAVLEINREMRIVLVLAATIVLHIYGVQIETVQLPFMTIVIELGWLSLPLTAAWLLLCASLFGRAGSIPGVSYGVAAVTGIVFYLICIMVPWATGPAALVLALVVTGVSLPQMSRWGRVSHGSAYPSSYAMGFLIGSLAVLGALKHAAAIAALLPMLLISAPLFGATYAYFSRLRGMRIEERRQHLHEVLLQKGYSPRQVFAVLMGLTAYMGLLGLAMVALMPQASWMKLMVLIVGLAVGPVFFFLVLKVLRRESPRTVTADPMAVELFNVRLHPLDMDEALQRIEQFIRDGRPHMVVTSDSSAVVRAQEDEELRAIINEADLATMDGHGVVLCARLLDIPVSGRVAGCDMMQHICAICGRLEQPIALLGAAPGVAAEAARVLEGRHEGLRVLYHSHGYFAAEEEDAIIEDIRAAQPAVLFVAMGIPKQEKWIKRHMHRLGVPVCMGVGGSLDVVAGRVKRAPQWMQRCGLEWLYRTAIEPRRLPRLASLPRLFLWTLAEVFRSVDARDPSVRQTEAGRRR